MEQITTIFSNSYKIIAPLHHFDRSTSDEDVIIIITSPYDSINYIAVNNKTSNVLVRKQINCKDAIRKAISGSTSDILYTHLTIDSAFGIYSYVNSTKVATIFFVFKHKYTQLNYLVQLDVLDNNTSKFRIKGLPELYGKNHIYFDSTVTKNTIVTDYKTISDIDAYITYINMDNKTDIASANVEGIRILVTDEEKAEFNTHYNAAIPDDIYPYLDVSFLNPRIFFKLTEDTSKIKFNFSTGLGFLEFK